MEVLLEFRAGKMSLEGKRVIPDTRKGLVRIGRGEEGLIHFQWLDRVQNVVEDEPKAVDDQQLCSSVNFHINQPLADDDPVTAPTETFDDMMEDDISSRAGDLIGPSVGAEATSDVTSAPGPVKLADLQRILSNIGSGDAGGDAEDPDGGLALGDILKPELILPLFDMLSVEERLAPYMPEGQCTLADLIELLQCPPFRQQVDSFTYVLRTGQIDLTQFGIDPSKYKFTVLSFLEALEDSVSKQLESGESSLGNKDSVSGLQ